MRSPPGSSSRPVSCHRDDQRRVAWALATPMAKRRLGRGGRRHRADARAASRRPVTADIESGYGDTPEAVAPLDRARSSLRGAVGVNLEDGLREGTPPIRSVADAASRIARHARPPAPPGCRS